MYYFYQFKHYFLVVIHQKIYKPIVYFSFMGILFKTYKGKHQLHVYREIWSVANKAQLDEILALFDKKELTKAKITPSDNNIEIEMNGLIINCRDLKDLKVKFGLVADMKAKFQKMSAEDKKQK